MRSPFILYISAHSSVPSLLFSRRLGSPLSKYHQHFALLHPSSSWFPSPPSSPTPHHPPTSASMNKPHRLLSTQVSTTTCAPAGTTASSTRSAGKTAQRAAYGSVSRPGWTWEVSGTQSAALASGQSRAMHVIGPWIRSGRAQCRENVDGDIDGGEKTEK